MASYVCQLCKKEAPDKEPFNVPVDEAGVSLMTEHLKDVHRHLVKDPPLPRGKLWVPPGS